MNRTRDRITWLFDYVQTTIPIFLCLFCKRNHLLKDGELAILPLFFLLAEVGERVQFLLIALLVPTENDFLLLLPVCQKMCTFDVMSVLNLN